jgi:hypothetical protein
MIAPSVGIIVSDRERSTHSPESLLPETARFPGGSFHLKRPAITRPLARCQPSELVPDGLPRSPLSPRRHARPASADRVGAPFGKRELDLLLLSCTVILTKSVQ